MRFKLCDDHCPSSWRKLRNPRTPLAKSSGTDIGWTVIAQNLERNGDEPHIGYATTSGFSAHMAAKNPNGAVSDY